VTSAAAPAPIRKSVVVNATPTRAFDTFTAGIDRWWPKSHSMGGPPFTQSFIEPFKGGRWYAKREDGSQVTIGHVLVWEPGHRVVFRWEIGPQWKSDSNSRSEVEVNFVSEGPGATRVELEHRGFEH